MQLLLSTADSLALDRNGNGHAGIWAVKMKCVDDGWDEVDRNGKHFRRIVSLFHQQGHKYFDTSTLKGRSCLGSITVLIWSF